MEKKRIEYLDAIKGFAIILMVMGHVIAWNYSDYNEVCVYNPSQPINVKMGGVVWQLIYSFHMPLFFMVSGYLAYKPYLLHDFLPYIKKKTLRLLIPWISTIGIAYLVRDSVGYWFLLCLFQISILGFATIVLFEKINLRRNLIIDLLGVGFVYLIFQILHADDWNIGNVFFGHFVGAIIPFSFGILLRKHKQLFCLCVENSWFYTISLLLFGGIFCSRYLIEYCSIFDTIYNHSRTLLSLLGSLIVFHTFSKNIFTQYHRLLSYLGRKTLPIYILHIMFVLQIHAVGEYILSLNAVSSIVIQICYSMLVSAIAIILSLMIYKFLTASPLLKRIMFGE